MKRTALLLIALLLPNLAAATLITFDLRDPFIETIDEVNSFDYTVGGVTATLTAFPATYTNTETGAAQDLVLNQTTSSFGINVEGVLNTGGCTGEQSSQLDDGCIVENIVIALNTNAILVSVRVSSFGSSDEGVLSFQDGAIDISILSTGVTTVGNAIGGSGNQWAISFVASNGFSFDNFVIETVPEPSTLVLLGAGLIGLLLRRKRVA